MSTDEFADFLYGACLLRLGRRARAHAALRRPLRRRRRGADRRRRHRPAPLARGPVDEGRRGRREHPGRRVLRLPGRGLRRGHDRVHGVPGRLRRPRRSAGSGSASRAAGSSRRPPTRTRTTSSRRSTPTRARAGSASSGSAATRGSRATCGTRSSTRRSTAPCTRARQRDPRPRRARTSRRIHWDIVKDLRLERHADRPRRRARPGARPLADLEPSGRCSGVGPSSRCSRPRSSRRPGRR